MDEATRARIFEPFFTTKEAGKGTGLGLATVYGIVSQSNGHIWVYSEPGQGTTFKIYFPATAAAMPQPHGVGLRELSVCGNETVLLVEDEERLRELLAHVLRDNGYKVITAANGKMALHVLEAHGGPLDLLLTDVVMPEMRGQELAETLQKTHPELAVIYMSGYTDNALIHSGAMTEGMAFLQKPFTPDVVLRRIRQVLNEVKERRRSQRRAV
jgi:CheY-like chemotaxis protein